MPELGGMAVLQYVREHLPQTFVVLMTAHASVETAIEALRSGAQDYILKPLIFEDILPACYPPAHRLLNTWRNH